MILDIHLEGIDDEGKRLERVVGLKKPVIISLVPILLLPDHPAFGEIYPHNYHYPERIISILKEGAKEPHIVWGQQGFTHYCSDCFNRKEKRDPWHENNCLYNPTKSVEEQIRIMRRGKRTIENTPGVSPQLYTIPNHQGDTNTKIAAEESGYEYLAVKDLIGLAPYMDNGLKILPQRKLGQKGEIIYTHYDKMAETDETFEKYMKILNTSVPLSEIEFVEKPLLAKPNEQLVIISKLIRDWKKLVK